MNDLQVRVPDPVPLDTPSWGTDGRVGQDSNRSRPAKTPSRPWHRVRSRWSTSLGRATKDPSRKIWPRHSTRWIVDLHSGPGPPYLLRGPFQLPNDSNVSTTELSSPRNRCPWSTDHTHRPQNLSKGDYGRPSKGDCRLVSTKTSLYLLKDIRGFSETFLVLVSMTPVLSEAPTTPETLPHRPDWRSLWTLDPPLWCTLSTERSPPVVSLYDGRGRGQISTHRPGVLPHTYEHLLRHGLLCWVSLSPKR